MCVIYVFNKLKMSVPSSESIFGILVSFVDDQLNWYSYACVKAVQVSFMFLDLCGKYYEYVEPLFPIFHSQFLLHPDRLPSTRSMTQSNAV